MTEPRDDLDSWLDKPVQPLLPPPGTFERIRKRARRRKLARAAVAAAGAVALVTAGASVPRLVISRLSAGPPAVSVSSPGRQTPQGVTSPAVKSSTPLPTQGSSGSPSAPPPVPPRFRVYSVTFVGTSTGWVIGQAGTPGQCGPPQAYTCTSIARTDDGGRTWQGVPAPVTGSPNGSRGVGQIRFLDTAHGWAFGPELWSTADGGQHWDRVQTNGMRVLALEAVGQRAFAIWASCTGTGPAFAGNCHRFALYSAPAGSSDWQPVPGTASRSTASAPGSAALVLTQARGYLLTPGGKLVSGPVSGISGWQTVSSGGVPVTAPCAPGSVQADGYPGQALFAATGQGLALLCASPAGNGSRQAKKVYYSPDGGATWQAAGSAPAAGIARSLAGTPSGALVLATSQGIEVARAAGRPWRTARGASPPGGFTYVGMTFDTQGVAVPADRAAYGVWITYSYGLAWSESPVTSARP